MSLETADVAHMLAALAVLVVAAHAVGHLFVLMRQPAVIGEIVGGIVLGPTVLDNISPGATESLFLDSTATASVLGALYHLGLLLLMFLAGSEVRIHAAATERKAVAAVTSFGLVLPFAGGVLVVQMLDHTDFSGPRGSPVTFALVFAIAIAITSVPVISRIMMDLDILDTALARIVLTVAVLEDLALYVVLAVVLGLAQAGSESSYGLWGLLGVESTALAAAYYVVVSLAFFAISLTTGAAAFRWLADRRFNLLERRSPTAFRLVFLLAAALSCVALGINPIFGALVAGLAASRADAVGADPREAHEASRAWEAMKRFSLAFFVPVYFALVGLQLDLLRHLDVVFFAWFLVAACAMKSLSVWLGARVAGEDRRTSVNLAVALNARGGPGIVLATVAYGAGIINENFFTALVLLSILTSQIAGVWLDHAFASGARRAARDRRRPLEVVVGRPGE